MEIESKRESEVNSYDFWLDIWYFVGNTEYSKYHLKKVEIRMWSKMSKQRGPLAGHF